MLEENSPKSKKKEENSSFNFSTVFSSFNFSTGFLYV
jgi:hypothetical protein